MKNNLLSQILIAAILSPCVLAIPEPDTVLYGRVLHLGGGEEHVVTSGELNWTVTAAGQEPFSTSTTLTPMKQGRMSYAVRIPRRLAVPGTHAGVLPGLIVPDDPAATFRNTSITVNGLPVRLADPAGVAFNASEQSRGSFRRLDLIIEGPLPDSDHDGLPDWWEHKYGTDPLLADADGDPDRDGSANLAEYLAGTDPTGNDQQPKLPAELLASMEPGGIAVLVARAVDSDTPAEKLTYSVVSRPDDLLFECIGTEGVVEQFTQAEVESGRVLLRHSGADVSDMEVKLELRDETSGHAAAETTLRISVSPAATLWEGWSLAADGLPDSLPAVQDGSRLSGGSTLTAPPTDPADETDIARLFVGSPDPDAMYGSALSDIFVAGDGDTITCGDGADAVLFAKATGVVTISDYSVQDRDILDLRAFLNTESEPQGRYLSDFVRIEGEALEVDRDADGVTDLLIALPGADLPAEAADLWDLGLLESGDLVPATTLFLAANGSPQEENLETGSFVIRRRGDVSAALDVPVRWGGTAVMGRDILNLPGVAKFAPGEKQVTFTVQPLADDEKETPESVQIEIGTSDDGEWVIADGSRTSSLTIVDLPSRVWLEVVERTAFRNSASGSVPAQILIRRSGPLASPLTVRLQFGGMAVPGIDFERLPASVTFEPAQDVMTLDILPLGEKSEADDVIVKIGEDSGYLMGATSQAQAILLDAPVNLSAWIAKLGITENAATFAATDHDSDGLNGMLEFAFGTDPSKHDGQSASPTPVRDGEGRIGIEFQRRPAASSLRYVVQRSHDAVEWQDLPDYTETAFDLRIDGIERVRVFMNSPFESGHPTLFRVLVRDAN
ncbi:MAG: hypothetical protein KDN22_08015 [Verrucomicrobiae bacterium]|nr:hypothetical protein [Verrucomicrobiae bacterium]